jgi:hypothetical protein
LKLTKKAYKLTENDFFIPNLFANICISNNQNNNTMKHDHHDSYGVFCIADRMLERGREADPLDRFWEDAIAEYTEFLDSEFNVDTESELDCIDEYFNNK